ncbi:MAG: HDOD domain-containing protein [Acidobacteria bacterium]|nr:HDOD domain-containing protein [Acidobacteriota bacterium]
MAIPQGLLQGIDRLDPLPITVQRLLKVLEDEEVGPAQIAEFVQYDPAVASTVLRLANSAAYGGWTQITTLRDAVVRLGVTKILDIALGDHLRRLKVAAPLYDLAEDDLWLHSAAASLAVKALQREVPKAGVPESASIAALVHDIGKLVMVRYLKADVSSILKRRDERGISFVEAERDLFDTDHAEVGGEMARRWGFPDDIQVAIERHHQVPVVEPSPTLDAVMVANLAAKAIGTGLGAEGMDIRVDDKTHRRLGLDFAGFSRVCIQTMVWLKEVKASYGVKS